MNLSEFTTESRNQNSMNLDEMSALEIVKLMNEEDAKVPVAIANNLNLIADLIEHVADSFRKEGRLIYIGAGTSGRLGVLDAAECVPTFGTPASQVIGLIAGGDTAMRHAVEGAEDSLDLAQADLKKLELNNNDIVVGIAASGRTPYVIGGLQYAKSLGCLTAAISCNKNSKIGKEADIAIDTEVGAEVLTGSTRLKAGTTQKNILNMITTGAMVLTGKAYQNLMVDVQTTNEKLQIRAENIVMESTEVDRETAAATIKLADHDVKLAIVMILTGLNVEEARVLLDQNEGHIKKTLSNNIK